MTGRYVLDMHPGDIYWCTADPGWVTGVSYGIIAPCLAGLTQIQFSGNFNSASWMEIIDNFRVNILYSAPTVFRVLMQNEDSFFSKYNFSELKRIYCVGEPLNPVIIDWGRRIFGKDIYDTWFQTETGSIMIAMRPGLEIRPGSMGKPLSGISAQILDESGTVVTSSKKGLLCIKKGWPSMFTAYINHPDTYKNKYFGDYYSSGDIAYRDEDGYFWFIGRNDDVINTAGHLVSPFEVESALLEIPEIADAGIVGIPDEMLYEKVVAYVVLRSGVELTKALDLKIKLYISNKISSIASPREIKITASIPKTKSGKIMRRYLKNQYLNLDFGDLSTLESENG
jgi:acetyl-CoA synthetase